MDDYIELNRGFAPYEPGRAVEADDQSSAFPSSFFITHTWEKILGHRATVIIAEAGTGKSWEFRHQATQLQQQGKSAFYCPIENLHALSFKGALEIGTAQQLDDWLAGETKAWFFLDAVDEAKLRSPRQFEHAIAKYVETVEPHRLRTHTIISTRPHSWDSYTDGDMMRRRLNLAPKGSHAAIDIINREDEDVEPSPSEGETTSPSEVANPPTKRPPLYELQLVPLDHHQIRLFAVAKGLTDVEKFMEALERSNADAFANRPSDLPGLIDIWRRTGKLGSYSDIVLHNIQLKLKEHNNVHVAAGLLTPERALIGAERIAAAVTFSRKASLLVSNPTELDDRVREQAIDPRDVLLDWRPIEVNELLGRALFDESLYGTVRFHHRTAREYLASRWICRLLRERKHRRSIKNLFLKQPYGTEPLSAVPSLKPILGWVSLWDQDIRDDVLRTDPKVLLEYGDAAALPLNVREKMLRDFAVRYSGRTETPLSLNLRELQRLTDPGLATEIRSLLWEPSVRGDVKHLLLRMVREGNIPGFGQLALDIVRDSSRDHYSRAYAIEIIGKKGSVEEQPSLKDFLLANASNLNRDLIGYGIGALFPGTLNLGDVESLLRASTQPSESTYDLLQSEIDHMDRRLQTNSEKAAFVEMLSRLLFTPPYVDDYCRVNASMGWLLRSAIILTDQLLTQSPDGPYAPSPLTILAASLNADHLRIYTGDTQKTALSLMANNRELKNAVFWHLVDLQRRDNPDAELIQLWQLRTGHRWAPELADAPFFLEALANRTLRQDRQLALSALTLIHMWNERPIDLLSSMRLAVEGDPTLTRALDEYLSPTPPSQEQTESERRLEEVRRESEEWKRQRDTNRAQWIQYLREDPSRVGDLSRIGEGVVFQNSVWLFNAIRDKKENGSSWTVTNIDSLIPEFGSVAANAFRDYLKGVWRRYIPKLRSEVVPDENSTPWAVIFGLSGLALEVGNQPEGLTAEEARLATRFAVWELNGFPPWLEPLWRSHPQAVEAVLLPEIAWELSRPQPEGRSGYILSRLRWSAENLAKELRIPIIEILLREPTLEVGALSEALAIILRQADEIPSEFTAAVRSFVDDAPGDALKALWIAALLCLDADTAMERLTNWVSSASSPDQAERRLSDVLNHLWGDRFRSLNSEHYSFKRPCTLLALIKLTYRHIRPEEDIEHEGAYSPSDRDHAQEARSQMLNILYSIPGHETYLALLELSYFHIRQHLKERMLVLAEHRAEMDCEAPPWEPYNVAEFAADAERTPRSQADLHALAISRLDDLKLDLEDGDESEASLLQRVVKETELRRVIANRLKQASAGKYTTGSEEELADQTRTDIRLHNPSVDARIPIELKIAEKWAASELRDKLETQLIRQYLREARFGIFLVVRRGNDALEDKSRWFLNAAGARRSLTFSQLIAWLQQESIQLVRTNPTVDGLEVLGIDLTLRRQESLA